MRKIRLQLLRVALIIVLSLVEVATKFIKTEYHYPVKWLNHFLKGSGKAMLVPEELVAQAKPALKAAISRDCYYNNHDEDGYICNDIYFGKWCLNHSTLYEGSGFHGRPTLFYLLGGFTFRTYPCNPNKNNGNIAMVSGKDYYDWHSNGEDGNYFTSPLGDSKPMVLLIKLLGLVFGNDLFVTNGWPSGNCGISNKLWEEMYKVGAKSFYSYFENVPLFTWSDMVEATDDTVEVLSKKEALKLAKEAGIKHPVVAVFNEYKYGYGIAYSCKDDCYYSYLDDHFVAYAINEYCNDENDYY